MHYIIHTKIFKESKIQFSPNVLCFYLLYLIIFVLGETENKGTKIVCCMVLSSMKRKGKLGNLSISQEKSHHHI